MDAMQGPRRVRPFSAACVHAVESSEDGSGRSHLPAATRNVKVSSKEMKKKVKKFLSPLNKKKWRVPQAFRSGSRAAAAAGTVEESDGETFASANNSELRSFRTDDDDGSEVPSLRLSPLIIFPLGVIENAHPHPAASPVKIVRKLPFGYVIGRQTDDPDARPPSLTLARKFKKMVPGLADLQLRARSTMIKRKVVRALKERFGRGGRRGEGGDGHGEGVDEDVFWKKDVRGLRCRRVDDDDTPY